ncbi:MAG: outer membrane beta-barrel protein [Gemmatimonadaceae bacterium]
MRALILVAAALFPVSALVAQRPIAIGIAGGASAPQGRLGDGSEIGWHALATVNLSSVMLPLGIRIDAAYNRFSVSQTTGDVTRDGYQGVGSLTGNLTYRLPMWNSPFSPYLIGGMGAYRSRCSDVSICVGDTEFGWNAGLGTKLYVLGFRSFLEARYHRTERLGADVHFIPVSFGIVF